MSNFSRVLLSDCRFVTRLAREGADMLTLSQVSRQTRQQVQANARGLLLNQPYVETERAPDLEWLGAQPPCFSPLVLRGLVQASTLPSTTPLPIRQSQAVTRFLRHVQAPHASIERFRLTRAYKTFANRLAPLEERRISYREARRAEAARPWSETGLLRPGTGTWAQHLFVRNAEVRPAKQQWSSLKPGLTLAALVMQRLPHRFVNSNFGQSAAACLGLLTGVILGCLCFVLAANPLLHQRFSRSAQLAAEYQQAHGPYSEEMLDRVWPGTPNPYPLPDEVDGEPPRMRAERLASISECFTLDKRIAITQAVNDYRWNNPPDAPRAHYFNHTANGQLGAHRQFVYPSIDEDLIVELDRRLFVFELNNTVHPDYPSDRLVRWLAGWQRPTTESNFFADVVSAMCFTCRKNDQFRMT